MYLAHRQGSNNSSLEEAFGVRTCPSVILQVFSFLRVLLHELFKVSGEV